MKIKELTGIIIARNEETHILSAIQNLKQFCAHIIVVDNESSDDTLNLANRAGVATYIFNGQDFASIRNLAAQKVTTSWFFYLDSDERVTPELAAAINKITTSKEAENIGALSFARQNFFYGHQMLSTGFDPQSDLATRFFNKLHFQKWTGTIHETAHFSGRLASVTDFPLWHFTHRSTRDNLLKSAAWTPLEAQLLANDPNTPPITPSLILRKTLMEFWRRYFKGHAHKDGSVGFIESLTQAFNRALVYCQVWEKQQIPSIEKQYDQLEADLRARWQNKV
jgi:glycosyltransferase involved in cell wall biosynthesis